MTVVPETVYEDHRIEYERPPLYPKQYEALFDPRRYSVIEASTKAGKTSGALIWLIEKTLSGARGQNFWWVSPVSGQAHDVFNRALMSTAPEQRNVNLTLKTITLVNGAVIWFKSGDRPDSLYGADVYAAVVDEASRVKEASWHAIRSTLTFTRGQIRIIGNVKGRENWFYALARKAQQEQGSRDSPYGYHKLIAHDAIEAGVLSKDEVADARRTLPERVFRELYLAEPSDDDGNPFGGMPAISKCIAPLSNGHPEVWGWDLAKKQDWTVGIALDREGRTCRFVRMQAPWNTIMQRIKLESGTAHALVDSTGVGDPILEQLQQESSHFEGYHFTGPSKQRLMEGLAVAIQSRTITFPDGEIVNELRTFEYEYTRTGVKYSAPAGLHDDCVCALALAVQHRTMGSHYDSSMSWVGGPDDAYKPPLPDPMDEPPRRWMMGGWR